MSPVLLSIHRFSVVVVVRFVAAEPAQIGVGVLKWQLAKWYPYKIDRSFSFYGYHVRNERRKKNGNYDTFCCFEKEMKLKFYCIDSTWTIGYFFILRPIAYQSSFCCFYFVFLRFEHRTIRLRPSSSSSRSFRSLFHFLRINFVYLFRTVIHVDFAQIKKKSAPNQCAQIVYTHRPQKASVILAIMKI